MIINKRLLILVSKVYRIGPPSTREYFGKPIPASSDRSSKQQQNGLLQKHFFQ